MRPRAARSIPLSIPLSILLVASLAGGTVAAAPRVQLDAARPDASHLRVRLATTGDRGLAGTWQVVLRGTGSVAGRSMRVVVTTGDVQFHGRVEVLAATSTGTRVVARRSLDRYFAGGSAPAPLCDSTLRACLDPSAIVLPADGNGKLAVTFDGLATGGYGLSGAARFAVSDAFVYGRWVWTGTLRL